MSDLSAAYKSHAGSKCAESRHTPSYVLAPASSRCGPGSASPGWLMTLKLCMLQGLQNNSLYQVNIVTEDTHFPTPNRCALLCPVLI